MPIFHIKRLRKHSWGGWEERKKGGNNKEKKDKMKEKGGKGMEGGRKRGESLDMNMYAMWVVRFRA